MGDITNQDIARVEAYMQTTFGNDGIRVVPRERTKDSAEVLLHGEFIGIVYKDEEDGLSFDFNMAILEEDLPQTA
jgi:hypothetical protein